jgi:hypothetical protein
MSSIALLREVKQLHSVSDRLDSLAEQYLFVQNTQMLRSNLDEGIGVQASCLPLLTSPLNQ